MFAAPTRETAVSFSTRLGQALRTAVAAAADAKVVSRQWAPLPIDTATVEAPPTNTAECNLPPLCPHSPTRIPSTLLTLSGRSSVPNQVLMPTLIPLKGVKNDMFIKLSLKYPLKEVHRTRKFSSDRTGQNSAGYHPDRTISSTVSDERL